MAYDYKLRMSFNFAGETMQAGFSEGWDYRFTEDVTQNQADELAKNKLDAIVRKRLNITGYGWTLSGLHISRMSFEGGKWKYTAVPVCLCNDYAQDNSKQSDVPGVTILVGLCHQGGKNSNRQLQGVDDSLWSNATSNLVSVKESIKDYMNLVAKKGNESKNAGVHSIVANTGVFNAYGDWCVKRMSTRKIGRPNGSLVRRGRASKKETPPMP
jgi:hypothetical protein